MYSEYLPVCIVMHSIQYYHNLAECRKLERGSPQEIRAIKIS
jgi:hypothetical protein